MIIFEKEYHEDNLGDICDDLFEEINKSYDPAEPMMGKFIVQVVYKPED